MAAVCEEVHGGNEEEEEENQAGAADEAMLWSIQEALERQTLQIGASACGATAVVDVLKALGVDVTPEEADRCVQTRLRRNESPLPDYLLSRSEAGEFPHVWLMHWLAEGVLSCVLSNLGNRRRIL